MKLQELYIQNYRVLRKLRLNFERASNGQDGPATREGYALDFLAGVNGTGKTTALQFIGRLFATLYETDYFPEPFEITYQIGVSGDEPQVVTITNIPDDIGEEDLNGESAEPTASVLRYRIGDGEFVNGKVSRDLLPRQVIIYTTGSEDEWQRNLYPNEGGDDDAVSLGTSEVNGAVELPGHRPDLEALSDEDQAPSPDKSVLFIRSEHLPVIALCGLIASV